jgi:D-alanine-D-alanine ligase
MQVTIIYGGRSVEHDWSIAIYDHFAHVLNNPGNTDISPAFIYYVSRFGELLRLALEGGRVPRHHEFVSSAERHSLASLAYLLKGDGAFVFSLLQGQDGEDGQIQALAQFHDIPGSFGDKTAAMLTANKFLQCIVANKLCSELTPIPTVRVCQSYLEAGIGEALRELAGPCVLKPNTLGGSFLTECTDELSEVGLRAYAERIELYDPSFLVQKRIIGTEYTCGVLIDRAIVTALPIARIHSPSGFLGYHRKTMKEGYSVSFNSLENSLQARIATISTHIAREFNIHTFARLDFIVDEQKNVHFFEVNLVPGLTEGAIFPKMLAEAGLDLCHLIRLAASNELDQRQREQIRKLETSSIRVPGRS